MANNAIITSTRGVPISANRDDVLIISASVMDDPDEVTLKLLQDIDPGSTVYTADLSFLAMKNPEGVWKEIGGEGEWTL